MLQACKQALTAYVELLSSCGSSHRPVRRAVGWKAWEPPTERAKAAEHDNFTIAEQLVTAACASRADV